MLGVVVFKNEEKKFVVVEPLEKGLMSDSLKSLEDKEKEVQTKVQEEGKEKKRYIFFLKEEGINKGDIIEILSVQKDTKGRKDRIISATKKQFKGVIHTIGERNFGFALVDAGKEGKASVFLSPFAVNKLKKDFNVETQFDLVGKEIDFTLSRTRKGLIARV